MALKTPTHSVTLVGRFQESVVAKVHLSVPETGELGDVSCPSAEVTAQGTLAPQNLVLLTIIMVKLISPFKVYLFT